MKEILMGQMPKLWNEKAKNITFCVTEDCNLACKYCYMVGKNSKKKMSFEIAKEAVDYILSNRDIFDEEAVVWDFIGGEPFLETELIDKICDYIKLQMYLLDDPWFYNYRFSLSTNGLLYTTKKVQDFIEKNYTNISIGISLDGNKIKHDLQRIYPGGKGSYDDVMKNVTLWQKQFPKSGTKSTFSSADLPYLKESIISLWENGIHMVMANVVFEDVWKPDDDIIFEKQLTDLADYIIENNMWSEYSVRFFDPKIGFKTHDDELDMNFCGTGKMLAIDTEGNFYNCIRFMDFSLNNKSGIRIGNVKSGIDDTSAQIFKNITIRNISDSDCINCEVSTGCGSCSGCNYDMSNDSNVFKRAKYICNMHKANVRACEYFWNKLSQVINDKTPRDYEKEKRKGVEQNYA